MARNSSRYREPENPNHACQPSTMVPRRSARLRQLAGQAGLKRETKEPHHQLPSPSTTVHQERHPTVKRKLSPEPAPVEETPSKRLCQEQATAHPLGSIAQWASTGHWSATSSNRHRDRPAPVLGKGVLEAPGGIGIEPFHLLEEGGPIMSQATSSRPSSGKRKSSSVHRVERIKKLSRYGISMDLSDELGESAKQLCENFLKGSRVPSHFPGYSPDQVPAVLQRAQNLNEARLHRDITPWVVPSAEHSYRNGEITHDYLVDEVQAEWIRCAPMGSTRPKPDLTIGLSPDDFDEEETRKLESYSSLDRPSFVTPSLCYPFLMVEAKTGEEGLNKADRKNAHSAGIAVNAIFELQRAAFEATAPERVTELFRKPLAFSVSHNGRQANLYAHFAVPSKTVTGAYTIQRSEIELISLFKHNGVDRYKPYNFALNVYQTVGQEHRKRIKDALAALPVPSGVSSGFTLETESRQDTSTQEGAVSEVSNEQTAKLVEALTEARARAELMEQQMKQLKEQLRLERDSHTLDGGSK